MNQLLGVTILFLTVLGAVWCSSIYDYSSSLSQDPEERLIASLKQICPEKEDEEFETFLVSMKECASNETSVSVCTLLKDDLPHCLKLLDEFVQPCVPINSKNIPQLITKMMNSTARYLCNQDGEHLFEIINPCIRKPSYNLMSCYRRIRSRVRRFQTSPPSASDFCDALRAFRPCFTKHVKGSCGSEVTNTFYVGLYDTMASSCDDQQNEAEEFEVVEVFEEK